MKLTVEPYLSLIGGAVRDITYPPIALVKLMLLDTKQAQEQVLKSLEQQLAQEQLEAEQVLTAFYVRHQSKTTEVRDYHEAIQRLGERNDNNTDNDQ
jgi:hypothetical protein